MHGLIPAVLTPNAVLAEAASDTQGPIAVVGAVAAAILIAKTMWTISERTVGRRILLKRRIARLGTTAQLSYFSETLKATPAISRSGTYTALELRVEGPEDESEFVGGEEEEEEEEEEESGLEPVERPYVESFYVFPDAYI